MNEKMMQPNFQGAQNTPKINLKEVIRTTTTILKTFRLKLLIFKSRFELQQLTLRINEFFLQNSLHVLS